ncbi:MAG: Mut7-C RNAse domain-containing protein [Acidobacteriia bacterium]|nr:Mut7-C RNAse domain-containing protein [Terriglobia bacterium]
MDSSEIQFAADRMLGRLAKLLRLLGYDTLYARDMSTTQLLEIAQENARVVLTRGDIQKRFPSMANVYSLKSEFPPEQLRELVERFGLDTHSGLWTRCTLCNSRIARVEKRDVESPVDSKVLRIYEDFFRCTGCGHVYWRGSHVERILRNLASLLGPSER